MNPNERTGFDPTDDEEREIAGTVADQPSDFLGLMGQFYRGAMSRTTAWRARLDRTTNWAVVITASVITFGFSSAGNPHFVMLGGILIVSIFLFIESRRYRMYDVWRSRVRILEENVLAEALEPRGVEAREWRRMLSRDLREPTIKVPLREAVARRLKRVYLPLLVILLLSWIARVTVFAPTQTPVLVEAGIAGVPGLLVVVAVFAFYWVIFAIVLWPIPRHAKGALREGADASWRMDEEDR